MRTTPMGRFGLMALSLLMALGLSVLVVTPAGAQDPYSSGGMTDTTTTVDSGSGASVGSAVSAPVTVGEPNSFGLGNGFVSTPADITLPAGDSSAPAATAPALANTGSESTWLFYIGAGLVAAGISTFFIRRGHEIGAEI